MPDSDVMRVALTGGIATGKSYVLARLKERGIATIDADDIVHGALGAGSPVAKAIAAQFGPGVVKADGSIHRTLLAAKVFSDPESRHEVEAIVHPVVYQTIGKWFETLDRPVGVASIPLLYETGRENDFDVVVVTTCPPDVQFRRLLEREGMTEKEARQRIAAQLPSEEKAARGDFVILTGGSKLDTDRQVDEVIAKLHASPTP